MHPKIALRSLGAAMVAAALVLATSAGAQVDRRVPPLSTPELLVDLARDYGLNVGTSRTSADAAHAAVLLQAAVRLNPRSSDALALLAELHVADSAGAADPWLERLIAADPGHEGALRCWLMQGPPARMTPDRRLAWLDARLAEPRPPSALALMQAQRAAVSLDQLDADAARRHLELALRTWPDCPDAVMLSLPLMTADTTPVARLTVLLRALVLSPHSALLAWEVGYVLHNAALPREAQPFFDYAIRRNVGAAAEDALGVNELIRVSQNLLLAEKDDDALALAESVANSFPESLTAQMHVHWMYVRAGRTESAEAVLDDMQTRAARIVAPQGTPVGQVAEAAWFHCRLDPQPQRAMALASDAVGRAPNDAFARRALAWAQAAAGRTEEAERTALPIARDDPYAACLVARLRRDADRDAARSVIESLRVRPLIGPAREAIDALDLGIEFARPTGEPPPEIAGALAAFPRELLDADVSPAPFVSADARFLDVSVDVGEPWVVEFSLTSKAKFPIALGPAGLLNPTLLVSLRMEGDRTREFPALHSLHFDRSLVLAPGATLTLRRTVDVGPPRRISRQSPQQLHRVVVEAVMDPRLVDGRWRPGPQGVPLRTVAMNRLPQQTNAGALDALFRGLTGQQNEQRFQSLEALAELLGEAQRGRARSLGYSASPVPEERIVGALIAALSADSPETRARAMDSLMTCGLDVRMFEAVRANLAHADWLVRFMAVRVLARQGAAFREEASRIATSDGDELVRELARSYVEILAPRAAASQPASGSAPATSSASN